MNQPTEQGSKAYLISIVMVAVLGGLLFGYDTAVISGAEKGLQAFFMEAKDFAYTDGWHGFTSASALIGCIIGSALSGYLATNLGRKKSLIIAGLLFFISALGSMDPEFMFFEYGTPTYSLLIMFNFYRVIGGVGVGLASAICPMYIGEVAPSNIRGMLVSWNQFAIIFGQLVVYFVNFFILGDHIQPLVEEMKTEKLMTYGALCIFVGIMLSVFQQAVGINAVLYYAPRIFGDMGMDDPMMLTVFMGIINISFTLVAVFTVEKLGRKPLLISGSLGMALGAFGVAVTFGNESLALVTAASLLVYSASFMFSWGPITWVLIAEIFPNTIRGGAVAIAVAFQWISNFIVSSSFVPMFNMHLTEGDDFGHWFTYGLYGIICVIAALFVWRLVPETKGKTLEDMSKLWKKN